jgi:hypothetical protein
MAKRENNKFLIYKITNLLNGKIYVGAHITNNIYDKYMGSSKHLLKDIREYGKQNFLKEILFVFDNKKDMIKKESEIVDKNFCFREDTYNRMIGGLTGSFNYNGMTTVRDADGNVLKVYLDDPRYLSGELTQVTKGTIPVINKNGKKLRVYLDDPRYLSGELIFNRVGQIPVRDKDGNTFSVDKNDPRYLSGELKYVCVGQITVRDKDGNTFSVDKNDPRYLSGELKHNLNDTIVVKDRDGNRFIVSKNDHRYLSGELVGWAKGRPGIKGMLGKKRTEEVKEKLRKKAKLRTGDKSSGFGRVYINNEKVNKRVKKEEVAIWIENGWKIGRKPFKHIKND